MLLSNRSPLRSLMARLLAGTAIAAACAGSAQAQELVKSGVETVASIFEQAEALRDGAAQPAATEAPQDTMENSPEPVVLEPIGPEQPEPIAVLEAQPQREPLRVLIPNPEALQHEQQLPAHTGSTVAIGADVNTQDERGNEPAAIAAPQLPDTALTQSRLSADAQITNMSEGVKRASSVHGRPGALGNRLPGELEKMASAAARPFAAALSSLGSLLDGNKAVIATLSADMHETAMAELEKIPPEPGSDEYYIAKFNQQDAATPDTLTPAAEPKKTDPPPAKKTSSDTPKPAKKSKEPALAAAEKAKESAPAPRFALSVQEEAAANIAPVKSSAQAAAHTLSAPAAVASIGQQPVPIVMPDPPSIPSALLSTDAQQANVAAPKPPTLADTPKVAASPTPTFIVRRSSVDLTGNKGAPFDTAPPAFPTSFSALSPAAGADDATVPLIAPSDPVPVSGGSSGFSAPVSQAPVPLTDPQAVPVPVAPTPTPMPEVVTTPAVAEPTAPVAAEPLPAPIIPPPSEPPAAPATIPVPATSGAAFITGGTIDAVTPPPAAAVETTPEEPIAAPPIEAEIKASEPAPTLSPQTQKVLNKVPSNLDKPKKSKKEKITVDRISEAEKAREEAAGNAVQSSSRQGLDISVDTRRPKYDANYDLNRAYNALTAGDSEGAIALYKNILENDRKNKQALFGLATTYHRVGQLEKARPIYSELLSLDPKNRDALNNFLALAAEEAPQNALEELRLLAERNPDFSPIPAQMAVVYQKMGQTDQAIDQMVRAVSLSPENLTYRYNLAVLLDKAGRGVEAAGLYRQLLEAHMRGERIPGDAVKIQQRLTFLGSNRQ